MKDIVLELLNHIYEYGYEAYAVGGFVRDYLLGIDSNDIDINTNATPMELVNIFPDIITSNHNYGTSTLYYKNTRFEITTFRSEGGYSDNRHPSEIIYINDLKTDLLRRDFTINSICMDRFGNIIDLLNGKNDLDNRVIKCINDPFVSFRDDSLRILRALRFSLILDFRLDDSVINSIKINKKLLRNISYYRKKNELDKIFVSNKCIEGIKLMKDLDLINVLDLDNIDRCHDFSDLVGIWSMINSNKYPFNNSEKELIKNINIVYDMDNIDNITLYKYGLYVNLIVGVNKGYNKQDIIKKYDSLPIKEKNEINIKGNEIALLLNRDSGSYLKDIISDLEYNILCFNLNNDRDSLEKYILDKYK